MSSPRCMDLLGVETISSRAHRPLHGTVRLCYGRLSRWRPRRRGHLNGRTMPTVCVLRDTVVVKELRVLRIKQSAQKSMNEGRRNSLDKGCETSTVLSWKMNEICRRFPFYVGRRSRRHGRVYTIRGCARSSRTRESTHEPATRALQAASQPCGPALHGMTRAKPRTMRILHLCSARMIRSGLRLARRTDTTALPWVT